YVFHDSRGLESGTADELQTIQDFVGERSCRNRLRDRLHAIWSVVRRFDSCHCNLFLFRYCIPMDDDRASLNIEPFHNICPDKNGNCPRLSIHDSHVRQVPVIAVFTKFETFKDITRSDMVHEGQKGNLKDECEKRIVLGTGTGPG
ncbi:hypothetical protein B0H13DRAFT_1589771, partial [Mycena leptocephala]